MDQKKEAGFTLIELMWVIAILSILAALSWLYLKMYMQDAEYTKAEANLRNARTAAEAGDNDDVLAANLGYTLSGATGGEVPVGMQDVLPGATTPEGVRLGMMYNDCTGQLGATVNHFIVSQPCRSDRYTRFTKLCNGVEILESDVAKDYSC